MTKLKDVVDFGMRVLDTHDPKVERAIRDKNVKSRGFLNALKEVWSLKPDEKSLRKAISLFANWTGNKEDLVLNVGDYFWSAVSGMTRELWETLEREAVKEGIFTKGGFMHIKEHFKEEGRREGMQQGMQQGMQRGMQRGGLKKERELILNMLRKQTDIAFISEVTGLPEEKIKKIQNGG